MNNSSIPRLGKHPMSVTQQPLTMREGQMFHGQIKQLFPGQMAEVQLGSQRLMAKLEVPMKAGDAYYFQVNSVNPELQIKVVSGPLQAKEGQAKQLSNLMDSMQLPKSPEMITVLKHFLKEGLPVSKENLMNAVSLLKTVPSTLHNEAFNSIRKLVELKLPLNEFHFNSLLGVEKKDGLHEIMHALRTALTADSGLQTHVKDRILATIADAGRLTATATEKALINSAMLQLLDEAVPREERFQVMQLLKSSGVMSPKITLANVQSVLHADIMESRPSLPGQLQTTNSALLEAWKSVLREGSNRSANNVEIALGQFKNLVNDASVLQQSSKLQIISYIEEMARNSHVALKDSLIGEQVSKMMIRMALEESRSMPFHTNAPAGLLKTLLTENASIKLPELLRTVEQSPLPIAKDLMQSAYVAVEQAIDGKVMKEVMQSLFKIFGFNYEAGLLSGNMEIEKAMDMLKPQLVALLHDSVVSPALRDAAETMIARMNGSLLQSGDSSVSQQINMQLPIDFLGKRIDATIQWNGRKKDDGKIDADYARILFYLQLESIDKTVVDMQVQNRVVTLTIFNDDHELKEIGNLLQMKLKDGLEEIDYRLSGVAFKHFTEEEENSETKRQKEMMPDHGGVDFRI